MIRIRSHQEGFCRAGVRHPAKWKEYPDDTFNEEQLEQLMNEPMLQVDFAHDEEIDEDDTIELALDLPPDMDFEVSDVKVEPSEDQEPEGETFVPFADPEAEAVPEALPKFKDITVDQIKDRLDQLGVLPGEARLKSDLYALLEAVIRKGGKQHRTVQEGKE